MYMVYDTYTFGDGGHPEIKTFENAI